MRRPWLAGIIAVLLSAGPHAGMADDLKTLVDDLRQEPMTLFDWGMFLLEEELQSVRRQQADFLRAYYQPETQRIIIDAVFAVDIEEINTVRADRACYTRHHAIKLTLGIIDTDRIHISPGADFRLGMKFSHHQSDAYAELPDAAKIGRTLFDAIDIRVGIASNMDNFPFDQDMRCTGPLMSQDVTFTGLSDQEPTPQQ